MNRYWYGVTGATARLGRGASVWRARRDQRGDGYLLRGTGTRYRVLGIVRPISSIPALTGLLPDFGCCPSLGHEGGPYSFYWGTTATRCLKPLALGRCYFLRTSVAFAYIACYLSVPKRVGGYEMLSVMGCLCRHWPVQVSVIFKADGKGLACFIGHSNIKARS